ncbi:MAG: hypothetical protein RJA77_615 [Pseudomonadota bacterium]|jgi:putative endonuclease
MPSPKQQQGRDQECHALAFLRDQGLTLLDQNVRFRSGELDLVCRHQGEVVFVEVRMRASQGFGGALASVDLRKQRRLRSAARIWWAQALRQGRVTGREPCRFDVIAIEAGELFWHRQVFD